MKTSKIYTKEILEEGVKNSINFSQVCRYLGKFPRGASYELIKNRIIDYGIDTSHFLGKRSQCGPRQIGKCAKKPVGFYLKSGYKYRAKSFILRRELIDSGIKYKCCDCGLKDKWLGKNITLHVEHINGDWSDCRLKNLRFLCPNCHSQTKTYSRNKNGDFV